MTCAPFSTAIPDYAFPSNAEEPMERLVHSRHRRKFVIKGGLLLSALYGLDLRTTMDIPRQEG